MSAEHPAGIYDRPSDGYLYTPFAVKHEPMERLLLLNIDNDPDTTYTGFEPQVFDDPITGSGLIVLAYRNDDTLDIYYQPGLNMTHKSFDIVGSGVNATVETSFESAWYEVTERGVDADIAFNDRDGRLIRLRVQETNRRRRKPFGLLAPFPWDARHPPSMPLAMLYDFYFVRRAGTTIEIIIDGKPHKTDNLPAPIDLMPMTFCRYSDDPVILLWNPAYNGPLPGLMLNDDSAPNHDGFNYDVVHNEGHPEIASMRPQRIHHDVRFNFNPAFPDVACLRDGTNAHGEFIIWMEPALGDITGTYSVTRQSARVEVMLEPVQGWSPGTRKLSVQLMFFLAKPFKAWPKTYRWHAALDFSRPNAPTMRSSWARTRWEKDGT